MKTLHEICSGPSGFDSYANYIGETPPKNWLVVLTRNRDSDCLTESNWECALEELGGESETVRIDRFGHWGCGWWESLSVKESSEAESIGKEIEGCLSEYPVLDEQHFSEKETEEAERVWSDCYDVSERIKYIRENGEQFYFNSLGDLLSVVRGKYFNGYASDLLY